MDLNHTAICRTRQHPAQWRLLLALALTLTATCLFLVTPVLAQEGQEVGTWAFSYPDNTRPGAVLDLRYLNEAYAGEHGFIKLSADGSSFVRGDGKPIRFWCCGDDEYRGTSQDMAQNARFLARLGVNMIRLHTQINANDGGPVTAVNQKEIDGIWRMVAAAKKEGIYVTISPYWATQKNATNWGIDGYTGTTDLWNVLFFNPTLQAGYKAWVKALYAPVNPYTGIPLSKDPAVAIIQVQNEDGMFFWTMQGVKAPQLALLGQQFSDWLRSKYSSLADAKAAWQGASIDGDNWSTGPIAILPTWNLTQDATGGMEKRIEDQLEFFTYTERGFYSMIRDYYKKTLGCEQLVNACNWYTADPIKLNDLERYAYTADDVIAVNKYYGGVHDGPDNGWRIRPGDKFTNPSALLDYRDLPTNIKQPVDHPFIITESSWVSPLGYQSEGPFLMAAYQSLTGLDNYYWFSVSDPTYQPDPTFNFQKFDGGYGLKKWSCNVPQIMGGFPACALMYRLGDLQEGKPVVYEERSLSDMYERKTPVIAEDKNFDPNRAGTARGQSNVKGADPRAFLVGPVLVRYGGNSANDKVADLASYLDNDHHIIKSDTGQIRLNYGKGLCTINSPRAQGVSGFLTAAGGPIQLSDITVSSDNPYATVLAVSMDNLPLSQSRKVLIQVTTAARPTGWQVKRATWSDDGGKTQNTGYEVVNTGVGPLQVVDTEVTVTLRNTHVTRARMLDPAGYPVQTVPVKSSTSNVTLTLPKNAMYVILE